jgi:hypothetical protein
MELNGDAFYQKAIHSLARTLAKLNPTPEDKVFVEKLKLAKYRFVLQKKIFFLQTSSCNNYLDTVLKRQLEVCFVLTRVHMKLL